MADVIIFTEFQLNWFKGYAELGGRKLLFTIDLRYCSYNSI